MQNHKRKIIIIGSAHPLRGGLAAYNERLAKAFIDNNDDVEIYTFKLQYPGFLFPGKSQYSGLPAPENLKINISVNSVNPFNWIKLGRKIKKIMPDIVIIKYWIPFMAPCFGTIAKIIRKNKHTKIISILDNIIPHEKHIFDKLLSKYFVKNVDGFVAMSESVLNDLNIFDKTKPREFCPHPLYDNFGKAINKNLAKKNLKLNPDYNYLLFFGFIRDYKGLDILLKAFADKDIANLPLKLIVAGEFYNDSKQYFDIIKKYNLQDRVIMSNDFIPDDKVLNYFCACDIVVQPYKTATQSGVTQIAYHFNKPMIVTDVGGLSEIVPDNKVGYVVNPSPEDVAEAILKFYSLNKEAEFLENIKTEKKKYSWQRMIEAINNLLNN
ncbi:MAG: glycosyltransferase [Bacteroidales bacterium]|nr:glycosyltransferase [Bacteroidales bacterium]